MTPDFGSARRGAAGAGESAAGLIVIMAVNL